MAGPTRIAARPAGTIDAVTTPTTDPRPPVGPAGLRSLRPPLGQRSLPPLRRPAGAGTDPPQRSGVLGAWPAMPTAWPSCGTGGPAPTASTSPPSGCPRASAPRSPRTTPWPRPCSRCAPSSSATRPTTPGSAGWCPRPSPRRWSSPCGPGRQQVVDELLDAALEAGQVDLVEAFAYPLPVRVICDLLGVPLEDHDRFKVWSDALARGLDPDFLLTADVIEARSEAILQFSQYFFELLAERRRAPGRRPAQPAGRGRGRRAPC